jgi:hypothetical protein
MGAQMLWRLRPVWIALGAVLLVVVTAAEAVEKAAAVSTLEDAVIPSSFSGLSEYGRFAVHRAVDIAEVVDMRETDDSTTLGIEVGFMKAKYRLLSQERPEAYVRAALEKTLESIGLRRQAGEEPALLVTAEIWRAHAWRVVKATSVAYVVEMNLVFELSSPSGQLLGRVYTFGDAQLKSLAIPTKKKRPRMWQPIFDAALGDAMQELVSSEAFRNAVGQEVVGSLAQPRAKRKGSDSKVTRIDYRSWAQASVYLSQAPGVNLSTYSSVELEDFEMGDKSFLKKASEGEVKNASAIVPAAVFERLAGLYPGLFVEAIRGTRRVAGEGEVGKRLLVRGRFRDFNAGDVVGRTLIGLGAGRVSFDLDITFVDAESGQELTKFRIDIINIGLGIGENRELEDIIDRSAADIVHYLQQNKNRKYISPVLARHTPEKPKAGG